MGKTASARPTDVAAPGGMAYAVAITNTGVGSIVKATSLVQSFYCR